MTKKIKIQHDQEEEIKKLLLYRKIIQVDNEDTLVLDNGTKLTIYPNSGCICGAGRYWIEHINFDDNVITNVRQEFEEESMEGKPKYYEPDCTYHIFVLSADKEFKILSVKGNDGNGYYGTGFEIEVILKQEDR